MCGRTQTGRKTKKGQVESKKTVKSNVVYLESGVKREYKSFQFFGSFSGVGVTKKKKSKRNENSLHLRYHGNGNSSFL